MKLPVTLPFFLGLALVLGAPLRAAEGDAAAPGSSGVNAAMLTVDMKKIFESHPKTIEAQKTLHDEVNASKNDERVAKANQLRDEIKTLDSKLALGNVDPAAAEQMRKERREKAAALQPLDAEIQRAQAARIKEAQDKAVRLRGEIIGEIDKAIATAPALESVAIVLDSSGPTLNGVPFVLYANPKLDRSGAVQSQIGIANAAPENAGATGQGLRIAVVDMKTVFRAFYKSKEAEDKINTDRRAAKAEYDARAAKIKSATDELKALDGQIANPALNANDRAAKTRDRAAKATALSAVDRDLKDFQSTHEKQLQEQATRMRSDIVAEIGRVINEGAKIEGHVDLIFDFSGPSLNALPILLRHDGLPDWTGAAINALNSTRGGASATPIAPPASSVSTETLHFAVLDSRRVSQALDASKSTVDAQGRPVKLPQEIVDKIAKAARETAAKSGIQILFDTSGPSLNGVPVIMARKTVPDISNEIITTLGATPP